MINQVLLTVEAAAERGLEVACVVLMGQKEADFLLWIMRVCYGIFCLFWLVLKGYLSSHGLGWGGRSGADWCECKKSGESACGNL